MPKASSTVSSLLSIFPSTGSISARAVNLVLKIFLFIYKFLKLLKRKAFLTPWKSLHGEAWPECKEIPFAKEAICIRRKIPLIPGFFRGAQVTWMFRATGLWVPLYLSKDKIRRNRVRNGYICRLFTSKKAKEYTAPLLFWNRWVFVMFS